MKGTIVRLVPDKGYGFIRSASQGEYFFHKTDFNGFWDDLTVDIKGKDAIVVTFDPEESKKGLRAANVRRVEHPNES